MASGERHIAGLTDSIETELRLKHKSGHWVWVLDRSGVVERDAEGRPLRLMGVQTDISKQKQAEAQLEQVNVRFRLALAASGTGIWHHDLAARKSYWDQRTREIFGLVAETDEVSQDLWHSYLHPLTGPTPSGPTWRRCIPKRSSPCNTASSSGTAKSDMSNR